MAIFQNNAKKEHPAPHLQAVPASAQSTHSAQESLIASDLSVEGKIEGKGHVRIAGRFKGDVNIEGNLSVDKGARLNGSLRARQVSLAGELEGNIESAQTIELLPTAVLQGDIKTASLTVNAGSRIRGSIDCGWDAPTGTKASNATGSSDSVA